jgi:hypothetical protein
VDGDRILGFPDVCQKTGVRDLIDSALVVKEHMATIDSSSGAVLHKYILSFVKILSSFFGNGRMHLLRFLVFFLGALPCEMTFLTTFVTFDVGLPVIREEVAAKQLLMVNPS